jgi:hypothetical protein
MQLEELVRRIRQGDKNAVKELVATYGNAVYQRALERTNDRELAREAARQTFGQFVAIVQQQPTEDGWSLWFGDLIERNINAYAQIGVDMGYIEHELEHELYEKTPAVPAAQPQRKVGQAIPIRQAYEQEEPLPRTEPPCDKTNDRSDVRSLREEVYAETPDARSRKHGHGFTVVALIVVCLLLFWVVAGVAMTMKWIPYYDLGYSWFNASVFRLF